MASRLKLQYRQIAMNNSGRERLRTGSGLAGGADAASDSHMVSGELPQTGAGQTKSGQAGLVTTVPFEVVRRTQFVFEPFLGSLIQLAEAGPPQAQNTEYFLPYSSPVQVELLEGEAWAAEVLRSEVEQAEVLRPEASQVELLQMEVLREEEMPADAWQAEMLEAEVSQEEILQAELLQAEALQAEALQAEAEQDAVPEIASAVAMKAQEEPAASAAADKIEEIFAKPAERVVAGSRLTPLVQEQWQIGEGKPREKKEKPSLAKRVGRWLWDEVPTMGGSRRRAERRVLPGLQAFYWSGGTPRPHEVVNISKTGFYMRTTELWSVETLLRITLQRPRPPGEQKPESVGVLARVVRIDEGGVGHEFVTTEALKAARSLDVMPSQGTNAKELDRFLEAG
jgi:hypothetical protein